MAGHAAAATGSATDSLGSSPLVPASGDKKQTFGEFRCVAVQRGNISLLTFPVTFPVLLV